MNKLIISPEVINFYNSLDKEFVNRILETVYEEALLLYLQRGFEQNGHINIHEKFDVDHQHRSNANPDKGGFVWRKTIEGQEFWEKVLNSSQDITENKEEKLFLSTTVFKAKYPYQILSEIEEYGQD